MPALSPHDGAAAPAAGPAPGGPDTPSEERAAAEAAPPALTDLGSGTASGCADGMCAR
jgi:hypothetical protein